MWADGARTTTTTSGMVEEPLRQKEHAALWNMKAVLGEMLTWPQLNVDFGPVKTVVSTQSKRGGVGGEVSDDSDRELLSLSSTIPGCI